MANPTIRFAPTRDSESIQGQSYAWKTLSGLITVTGPGTSSFFLAPAGALIRLVVARIETALDSSGTCEIGVDDNADALIDTADWTETTLNQFATNRGSANADFPNLMYLVAGDQLIITIGGTPTVGSVHFLIEYMELDDIEDHHWEVTPA